MQDNRVARRYASALFQGAKAGNVVAAVEDDLTVLVNQYESDPEFRRFIVAPYTSREEKSKILSNIFTGKFSPITMQLIRIMLEKGREQEFKGVHEEYVALRRSDESVAHAVVTSAEPLDDSQRTLLVGKLEQLLKKRIEPEFVVDASMIGGVQVRYENFIMDGSVKGALGRLRERLHRDVLKQS